MMTLEAKAVTHAEMIEKEVMRWHLFQKMTLQELSKYSKVPNHRQPLKQLILELNGIESGEMKLKFRQIKAYYIVCMKIFTKKIEKKHERLEGNMNSSHEFKSCIDKKSWKQQGMGECWCEKQNQQKDLASSIMMRSYNFGDKLMTIERKEDKHFKWTLVSC